MSYARRAAKLWLVPVALSLLMLDGFGRLAEPQGRPFLAARRIAGVAPAIVVDVHDPEASGRIKVSFPWLRGAEDATLWARVSLPLGGNATGLWALPEVGDGVLVAFEQGDLGHPVVLGSLWNGTDRPGETPPGQLTSPDGRFSISVTDSGITLRGPSVVVQITATDVQVDAANTLISSENQTSIASGGATNITSTRIRLNGANCPPVARVGDRVLFDELGVIVTGSTTVTSC